MQYITLDFEEFHRIRPIRNISGTCTSRLRKREFIGISITRKKPMKIMFMRTQSMYSPKQHANHLNTAKPFSKYRQVTLWDQFCACQAVFHFFNILRPIHPMHLTSPSPIL